MFTLEKKVNLKDISIELVNDLLNINKDELRKGKLDVNKKILFTYNFVEKNEDGGFSLEKEIKEYARS